MKKLIYASAMNTLANQLNGHSGNVYYLKEESVFLDYEGNAYGMIYSDPGLQIELCVMPLDMFKFENHDINLFVFDDLYQFINSETYFLLKDIIKWCISNMETTISKCILEMVQDKNLVGGKYLCKDYTIQHLSLYEFKERNKPCTDLKYLGYELCCLK